MNTFKNTLGSISHPNSNSQIIICHQNVRKNDRLTAKVVWIMYLIPNPLWGEQFVKGGKKAWNNLLSISFFVVPFFSESSNMSFPELPRIQQELWKRLNRHFKGQIKMKRLELFEVDRQKRTKEMPALKLHLVSY